MLKIKRIFSSAMIANGMQLEGSLIYFSSVTGPYSLIDGRTVPPVAHTRLTIYMTRKSTGPQESA